MLWDRAGGNGCLPGSWEAASPSRVPPLCWWLVAGAPLGSGVWCCWQGAALCCLVPVLPGLGVSESALAGQRPGPADKGTRSPNGCRTAETSLGILRLLRSRSRHRHIPLWSWESAGGADGREWRQPGCSSAGTSCHGLHARRGGACRGAG